MVKPRLLIVIPDDDISLELFFSEGCKSKMAVTSVLYEDAEPFTNKKWDFIYFRGPYINSDFERADIKDTVSSLIKVNKKAYAVDGIRSFTDMLREDKWRQYELFAGLMPTTQLVDSFKDIDLKNSLIKKRISGRSRDIHFDVSELPHGAAPKDYIVQERLSIQVEYRVFMVGGEIILPLEIKSGKTEETKNQVVGLETRLPTGVKKICQKVFDELRFDFAGLDIAEAGGKPYLIEVNRSPQFLNFWDLNKINLAESLFAYLLEKKH